LHLTSELSQLIVQLHVYKIREEQLLARESRRAAPLVAANPFGKVRTGGRSPHV